jgi:two-component system chemotaxis response regulator CheB
MSDTKIKVLVVDDSAFMRKVISDVLIGQPQIESVDTASNGQNALKKLREFNPDVITLDIEMPLMNGIEALQEILKIKKVPVIMCSTLTKAGAEITLKALELGAFDFIEKPQYATGDKVKNLEKDIINKVVAAASSKVLSIHRTEPVVRPPISRLSSVGRKTKLLVIGSSTGGPQALKEVVPYLPKDIPAKILMVQHMPEKFTATFAERLDKMSQITVKEAKEGDRLQTGVALLAPGNYHMLVSDHETITLNQEPAVWGVRPAVDMTLASVAKAYGQDVICVILTGMGHDGSQGAAAVKKYGGYNIVEHESTCVVYGMPKSVVTAGNAHEIVPIHQVAEAIVKAIYS